MRPPAAFRALGWFWAGVLAVVTAGAVVLQILGPPPPAARHAEQAALSPPPHGAASAAASRPPPPSTPPGEPGRGTPGPIPSPQPALLEPAPEMPDAMLPRIAADGRMPMQVYARGFDRNSRQPRAGLLLAGVGLNEADSEDAIRTLPGGITLAFSPYAVRPQKLLEAARLSEHEFLISIPMEPQGYPLNDAGNQALLTGAPAAQNMRKLYWALTRIAGYVGATGALGTLRGERFAGMPEQIRPVLQTLAERGLLYVDARPAAPNSPGSWGRSVDLVIDEPAVRPEIEAKLAQLEQIAREKGSALGLAGAVRPVTMDRIAVWASGLAARGVVLAPVSALVQPPASSGAAQ
jgi:polysaccharide deacetylase 2 family uncharacterized protein YibQ